jgi:hypothetical protein
MQVGDAADTITATVDTSNACLVASVDKPAIAAINTSGLTGGGTLPSPRSPSARSHHGTHTRQQHQPDRRDQRIQAGYNCHGSRAGQIFAAAAVNGTYTLTATVGPDDATDKTLDLDQRQPSDVSVDSTGTVKVLRNFSGSVVVTATPTRITRSPRLFVSVNSIEVDGIAISATSLTLYKGSWRTLTAVITPTNAADPAVTCRAATRPLRRSMQTAKSPRSAFPQAKTTASGHHRAVVQLSVYATCSVKVLSAVLITSLTLNKSELALNVGDEETLSSQARLERDKQNPQLDEQQHGRCDRELERQGHRAAKGTAVIRAESTDAAASTSPASSPSTTSRISTCSR